MSLSKLLLSLLVFMLAPVTLCFGSVKNIYDHTSKQLAAYPVPNVWLEGDPTNSHVAAMLYTGNGVQRYFTMIYVLVSNIGGDEGVDGGDWANVDYWKVFIFDVTAGDRGQMRNHFSVHALAQGGANVMVRNYRRPTNVVWATPIGYHPTGQAIYQFGFNVTDLNWQAIYCRVVFKPGLFCS